MSDKDMYVVMISPECAPVAKVGGLGDVIQGLSRELAIRGNAVEIILPKYDCLRYDRIWGLTKSYGDLWVPHYDQWIHCDVFFGFVEGLKCFFIDPHSEHLFFNRGIFYGHNDDVARFAFFSRAALEFMLKANKHPEIIHCHDWQTGLVPVLLYEVYKYYGMTHPRVCYTLHNVGHQGITGEHTLRQVGLDPGSLLTPDRLRDDARGRAVNLMKGGIVYSNFVTTVSPSYAWEIQHSDLGMGLQPVLMRYSQKLTGVLNGVDYNVWNPETDRYLACRYGIDTIEGKSKNKEALRQRLGLRRGGMPLFAIVSRLDRQKGMELMRRAIFYCLADQCQVVLLGSGPDPAINDDFRGLGHHLNENPDCRLEIGYNDKLARLIYAGADMTIIPSVYEPCGLTQMIAMKYGTVPIVRNTGGLADTVFDADYSDRPLEERNGYVFNDYNNEGLESALRRAIDLWQTAPKRFRELMVNGMRCDYSWKDPGARYLKIYSFIKEP